MRYNSRYGFILCPKWEEVFMQHYFKRKMTTICMTLVLLLSVVVPVFAEGETTDEKKVFTPPILGKINITSNSYVQVEEANILAVNDGQGVVFTMTVFNRDRAPISFIDYWPRVRSKNGTTFPVRELSDLHMSVPAQSSKSYSFYATLGPDVKLDDLVFELIKWNFEISNYEQKIGQVTVPANYSLVTPVDHIRVIDIDGTPVRTSIDKVTVGQTRDKKQFTFSYTLENAGKRLAEVPNYNYFLKTASGLMYSLDTGELNNVRLQPMEKDTFTLSVSIPNAVSITDMTLVITQSGHSGAIQEYLIAEYALPDGEGIIDEPGVGKDQQVKFSNGDGTYSVTLNSLQRFPWQEEDILSAEITLVNEDVKSLPVPNLSALFSLDGVEVHGHESQVVKLDNVIGIAPGASVNFLVYLKIPYTYTYDEVLLTLNERAGGSQADVALAEFKQDADDLYVPRIIEGRALNITDVGNRAEVKVRNAHTFIGETSDVYYVELEMKNLERRQSELVKLVGNFRTQDDIYYPATISTVDSRVSPNGKVLLTVTSQLPKGYDLSELELIIGEGLNGGQLATGADPVDAYMKAVVIDLKDEDITPADRFVNLDFVPYDLSIKNVRSSLVVVNDIMNAKVQFNYELDKQHEFEVAPENYNMVMEFVFHGVDYSEVFEIGTDLRVGKHAAEMITNVTNLPFSLGYNDGFDLNIYAEYNGHRKLIATRNLNWFTINSDN